MADLLHILNSNSFQLSRFPKNFGAIFAKSIILQNHNFEQYIYYGVSLSLSYLFIMQNIVVEQNISNFHQKRCKVLVEIKITRKI